MLGEAMAAAESGATRRFDDLYAMVMRMCMDQGHFHNSSVPRNCVYRARWVSMILELCNCSEYRVG